MGTILLANLKGVSCGLGSRMLLCPPLAEEVIDRVGIVGRVRVGPDDTVVAGIRAMLWSDTGSAGGAGGSVTYVGPEERKVC